MLGTHSLFFCSLPWSVLNYISLLNPCWKSSERPLSASWKVSAQKQRALCVVSLGNRSVIVDSWTGCKYSYRTEWTANWKQLLPNSNELLCLFNFAFNYHYCFGKTLFSLETQVRKAPRSIKYRERNTKESIMFIVQIILFFLSVGSCILSLGEELRQANFHFKAWEYILHMLYITLPEAGFKLFWNSVTGVMVT